MYKLQQHNNKLTITQRNKHAWQLRNIYKRIARNLVPNYTARQ